MSGGTEAIAASISADPVAHLPGQNKKQREGLASLVSTMLEVGSANLMDLSASLPRESERIDMRYQWISRLLGNELIDTDAVMAPFAREVLERAAVDGQSLVLIIDQTKANETQQGVVVAVRVGGRSLPIAWRVKETEGAWTTPDIDVRRSLSPPVSLSHAAIGAGSCGFGAHCGSLHVTAPVGRSGRPLRLGASVAPAIELSGPAPPAPPFRN